MEDKLVVSTLKEYIASIPKCEIQGLDNSLFIEYLWLLVYVMMKIWGNEGSSLTFQVNTTEGLYTDVAQTQFTSKSARVIKQIKA